MLWVPIQLYLLCIKCNNTINILTMINSKFTMYSPGEVGKTMSVRIAMLPGTDDCKAISLPHRLGHQRKDDILSCVLTLSI